MKKVFVYSGMITIFQSSNNASKSFITSVSNIVIVICQLPTTLKNNSALAWLNLSLSTNNTIGTVRDVACEGYEIKDGVPELRLKCSSSGDWVLASYGNETVTENRILDLCWDNGQRS